MLKSMFSPPASPCRSMSDSKPLKSRLLANPFPGMRSRSSIRTAGIWKTPDDASGDASCLVDTLKAFLEELERFSETIIAPCAQLVPDTCLPPFLENLSELRGKYTKLLKEIQELPSELPQTDSRMVKMAHVALNGMDALYKEYGAHLVESYIFIDNLKKKLPGRIPMMQDVAARITSPLDVASKLEAVAQRKQGLGEVINLARSEMAVHAQVEALEAQLRNAATPVRLADQPRRIQLRTTFDLTDLRWLGETKYFHESPKRIQIVLMDDRVVVLTAKNEALLVWSCVEDLRAIPLKPRAGDPFGLSMILVIRCAVAFRVFSPSMPEKDSWVSKLEAIMGQSEVSEDSVTEGACVFSALERIRPMGEEMKLSRSAPSRFHPIETPMMMRSLSAPRSTPTLCTEETRSITSSGSSLVNTPQFSAVFRSGLADRSSSSLGIGTKGGVCRFLSKPCHLLLNDGRGDEWSPHGVVSVEVRRLDDASSRLSAVSTRSQRVLLRMSLLVGIKLRKSSNSDVELVDQRATYRFLMEDQVEADELLSILTEELVPQSVSPTSQLSNPSMASLPDPRDGKATRLASVSCKLFILRSVDHTWSKAGQSQLELFQKEPKADAHQNTPHISLLVQCLDSTRKIHFPSGSFRCERIAPLKILVVHLDCRHHTTTIMLQLKTKQVVESLIAWLIC